jgi:hypothetical protein
VVIGAPVPAFGFGLMAAPFLNFNFGAGGGGGGVGVGMPGPPPGAVGAAGPAQPPPPPDQVALQCQRLQSFQVSHRKEAAYTLGRLGDPRAVPSLIHVLKYDAFKDVRVASAIALGEIGGSEAAVALERASIYDHREDVKKAATSALDRLNAKTRMASQVPPAVARRPLPAAPAPSPFRESPPAGGVGSDGAGALPEPAPPQGGFTPPPPPTPVTSGARSGGNS